VLDIIRHVNGSFSVEFIELSCVFLAGYNQDLTDSFKLNEIRLSQYVRVSLYCCQNTQSLTENLSNNYNVISTPPLQDQAH